MRSYHLQNWLNRFIKYLPSIQSHYQFLTFESTQTNIVFILFYFIFSGNEFENMEIQFVALCCRRKVRIMRVSHCSDRYGF